MSQEGLIVLLIIALALASLPVWPYSRAWGYRPTGILAGILVLVTIWTLAGKSQLSDTGSDIKSGLHETADSIKDMGRTTKDAVQDAIH